MSKISKEMYNEKDKFYLKDRYNKDEMNFYQTLLDINNNPLSLHNNYTIQSSLYGITKGANYYIDALRIFLSMPLGRELQDIGIEKSIKFRTDDEYSSISMSRLYSMFGSNRVFNFKGKINNLELNDYIDNYPYMTDLIVNEIIKTKESHVFFPDNPLEVFLNEENIKLMIKFYQLFAEQYSIPEICAFANDKIKSDVGSLDSDTDDYIERSKDITKEILDKISEHKEMYRLRLNEVNFLIKHLMALRIADNNITKKIKVNSNIFTKPRNPSFIKNVKEKRTNLTNLLLHQLQYYTEENKSKIDVYINLNKELCSILESILNNIDQYWDLDDIKNINPDDYAGTYILNANILEEYLLNNFVYDINSEYNMTNIYEIMLFNLDIDDYNDYFRALISLMYQTARYDGSYNLLEHVNTILNTAIIELPNEIEEYEYNRYIRGIYDSELIASNRSENIITVGTQNYLIPCDITEQEMVFKLICKIPIKDKTINMFDSNIYSICASSNIKERHKEYKKRSYTGIPYIVSADTQSYKDFYNLVSTVPENAPLHNKVELDKKESLDFLSTELESEFSSIEELYNTPNIYKFNRNSEFYKIVELIEDNFRVFYRDFPANELFLYLENGKIEIEADQNYCNFKNIIFKEYEEEDKKIDSEIEKVKNELELVNIQLGIKNDFSWDSSEDKMTAEEYADNELNKHFLKNKDDEGLIDVFSSEGE